MLGAVLYAQQEMQIVISSIREFAADVGAQDSDWTPPQENLELVARVNDLVNTELGEAYKIVDKIERQNAVQSLKEKLLVGPLLDEAELSEGDLLSAFSKLEKSLVRELSLIHI